MKKETHNKISLSCREVVTRHLRIFVSTGTANMRKEIRRSRITTLRDDSTYFTSGLHLTYNGNGFTLIELLVVVLIIGILAAVALPQYNLAVEKARVNRMLPVLQSIVNAEQIYYQATGHYTTQFDELDIDLPAGGTPNANGDEVSYSDGYIYDIWQSAGNPASIRAFYKNYLLEFYFNGRKTCSGKNLLSKKVCQNLTHKNTPDLGSMSGNNWAYFDF